MALPEDWIQSPGLLAYRWILFPENIILFLTLIVLGRWRPGEGENLSHATQNLVRIARIRTIITLFNCSIPSMGSQIWI